MPEYIDKRLYYEKNLKADIGGLSKELVIKYFKNELEEDQFY